MSAVNLCCSKVCSILDLVPSIIGLSWDVCMHVWLSLQSDAVLERCVVCTLTCRWLALFRSALGSSEHLPGECVVTCRDVRQGDGCYRDERFTAEATSVVLIYSELSLASLLHWLLLLSACWCDLLLLTLWVWCMFTSMLWVVGSI